MFVLFLRHRVFHLHLITGAIGFLIGCAPWLLWNMANDMDSLGQVSSIGNIHAEAGIQQFWGPLMLKFLYLDGESPVLVYGTLFVIGAGLLVFFARGFRNAGPALVHRFALLLFVAIACAIFSTAAYSQMGTPRYHLPLYPLLAIVLGYAVAEGWGLRLKPVLAVLPIIAFGLSHARGLGERVNASLAGAEAWAEAKDVEAGMIAAESDVAFGDWTVRWLNMATDERICIFEPAAMIYPAYAIRGELAERPVVLDSGWHANQFVYTSGGTSVVSFVHDFSIAHSIVPPTDPGTPIPRSDVSRIRGGDERGLKDVLMDRDRDTVWFRGANSPDTKLDIEFEANRTVSGLRFKSRSGSYPPFWQVWYRRPGSES